MALNSSLVDLETLFIEKLQEKYKLNKKDLKRAFSKFDKDNNGLLDLYELTKGIQLFLNGVKESQVQKLVAKYDKNGDGKISYDEFLYFLTNRTAIEEGDDESEYSRPSSAGNGGVYYNKGGKLLRQAEAQRNNLPSPARAAGPSGRASAQNYPPAPPPSNYPPRASYVDEDIDQMTDDFDASELGDHYSLPEYPPRNNKPTVAAGRPPRGNAPNPANYRSTNHIDQGYSVDPYADLGSARSEYSDVASRVSTPASEAPSAMDPHDPREIQARVKIFMDNLKTYLAKQASALRMGGQLDKAVAHLPAAEMKECVGRDLLRKAFQRYTGQGEGKAREQFTGVEAPEFAK